MNTPNTANKFIGKISLELVLFLTVGVLAIGGIGGSYYFYGKYKALKANPNMEAQKQTDQLISAVGKLMELPKGEMPTVATISDKTKLDNQVFFATAENGDVLFAYTTAMKAILYRPSTNKIINVAPISINQPPATQGTKPGAVVPTP